MKAFRILQMITVSVLTLSFLNCASRDRQLRLDEKVSAEKKIEKTEDLNQLADQEFKNAPGLTENQRASLMQIRARMMTESNSLRKESLKLRSVLIKDVVSRGEHVEEIKLIQERLKQIEDKRLDILFESIDQANLSLGKFAAEHQKELEDSFRDEHEGHSGN